MVKRTSLGNWWLLPAVVARGFESHIPDYFRSTIIITILEKNMIKQSLLILAVALGCFVGQADAQLLPRTADAVGTYPSGPNDPAFQIPGSYLVVKTAVFEKIALLQIDCLEYVIPKTDAFGDDIKMGLNPGETWGGAKISGVINQSGSPLPGWYYAEFPVVWYWVPGLPPPGGPGGGGS